MTPTKEIKEQFINDANESIYSPTSLTYYKPEAFSTLYPALNFANRSIIPVTTNASPGAKKYSYYSYDKKGIAELRSDYSKDSPKINIKGKESIVDIYPIRASMDYDDSDLKADATANRNLIGQKKVELIGSFQRRLDIVVANGQADVNLFGIVNHPNVIEYNIPAGASGFTTWETKTADEILNDLLALISGMIAASKGVHEINTFILPVAQYGIILGKKLGTDTTTTILGFMQDTYPEIKFAKSTRLQGASEAKTDMIIGCEASPDNFVIEIPQDYEEFPIFNKGPLYEQDAHMRTAGLIVYRPLTIIRGEGI